MLTCLLFKIIFTYNRPKFFRLILLVVCSELYHISGVRTCVQKVKPKMAEFEEL